MAHFYTDASGVGLEEGPEAVPVSSEFVDATTTVRAEMTNGGHATWLAPAGDRHR